jgi:hypothetical protein
MVSLLMVFPMVHGENISHGATWISSSPIILAPSFQAICLAVCETLDVIMSASSLIEWWAV